MAAGFFSKAALELLEASFVELYRYASSAEFVGEFWLGKLAKCVV